MATEVGGEYVVTPTQMNDRQKRGMRLNSYGALAVTIEAAGGPGATQTVANAVPVTQAVSGTTPLAGNFTAVAPNAFLSSTTASTGLSAAFSSVPAHAVWVKLRGNNPATANTGPGTFSGTVIVQKSIDGGQSWDPLTVGGAAYASFTGNCDEAVSAEDDSAALYRLACTAYTSGTIYYSIGHK
jgi:hypothetical protein